MRVLIAPLDWGLGHATRCIPIIREFLRQGCMVLLAGSGDSLALLREEFPALPAFTLPAYRPRYPRRGSMVWRMARQLPHFMKVVSDEHRTLVQMVRKENISLVISDNRYGCWSPEACSVFITHQSNILMPRRFGWLAPAVRKANAHLIHRFNTCWIPDLPHAQSLAGDLISTEFSQMKMKTDYIGWLSRFQRRANVGTTLDVVAVFSGPEPQRTLMEETVVKQLEKSRLRYRVIRGLPRVQAAPSDDRMVNFLTSEALQACIESAGIIIARSGYSTVMDMQALGKKVIFIPTPGQTEQEYLANRLQIQRIAFSMKQDAFDLAIALEEAKKYSGFHTPPPNDMLRQAVDSIISSGTQSFQL